MGTKKATATHPKARGTFLCEGKGCGKVTRFKDIEVNTECDTVNVHCGDCGHPHMIVVEWED